MDKTWPYIVLYLFSSWMLSSAISLLFSPLLLNRRGSIRTPKNRVSLPDAMRKIFGTHGHLYSKRTMVYGIMGPYVGVDYNLTLCRLHHIYYSNPKPESTLSPSQELRIWPQETCMFTAKRIVLEEA
jgi:hypothetical protein